MRRMMRSGTWLTWVLSAALVLAASALAARAQDAERAYFSGKTLRLVVGYGPGGGYDAYARMIAPHLSRVLGASVVVENQPGAGGLVALNYAGKIAPRDGTFMTLAGVGTLLQEATGGQGMQVSLRDFRWIGNFSKGLPHNSFGEVSTSAYQTFLDACAAGTVRSPVSAPLPPNVS